MRVGVLLGVCTVLFGGSIGQSVTRSTNEPKNVGYKPVCMDNGERAASSSAKE